MDITMADPGVASRAKLLYRTGRLIVDKHQVSEGRSPRRKSHVKVESGIFPRALGTYDVAFEEYIRRRGQMHTVRKG